MPKRKRKKSSKRVARGKKLARTLPRDAKGKFLPRGSKNLFRKKKRTKRARRASRTSSSVSKRTPIRKTMPKRRRTVGSTKDDYPNFMSGIVTVPGNALSNFVTTRVQTPIPRLKVQGNRATVMELLWVDVDFTGGFPDGINNQLDFTMSIGAPPDSFGSGAWSNPLVFAQVKYFSNAAAASSANGYPPISPFRYRMQSKDGYGYLLASDAFNVNTAAVFIQTQAQAHWKLFYRFVDIPLNEFIGIVQSTQQI